MSDNRLKLKNAQKIVVKVGTSTLTHENGGINLIRIDKLSMVLSDLINQGREVVLVTSGAIGVGVNKLKLKEKPHSIREKQAVAAVGQCELMHIYSKFFSEYGHIVSQILLTADVVEDDERRQNVINTFEALMEKGIIPIVNENDSVSVQEIHFGDNDTLSAIVAKLVDADLLIILSDIDGLYNKDPKTNPDAQIIHELENIADKVRLGAGGAGSKRGTGGMITKLHAADIAMENGIDMVIANGKRPEVIMDVINGFEIGTLFVGKGKKR